MNPFKILLKLIRGERIGIVGRVHLVCYRADGSLKWEVKGKNKITNVSLATISGLLANVGSQTAFTYLAVGAGTTAESAALTALTTEIVNHGLARVAATITRVTTAQTNDTVQFYNQWIASGGSSDTIEEIGIFNAASAGIMLGRKLTGSKGVASGEILQATYQIQIIGD